MGGGVTGSRAAGGDVCCVLRSGARAADVYTAYSSPSRRGGGGTSSNMFCGAFTDRDQCGCPEDPSNMTGLTGEAYRVSGALCTRPVHARSAATPRRTQHKRLAGSIAGLTRGFYDTARCCDTR